MTSSGTARVSLPADDQILIEREFNAPRRLVYRAWTTPELVRRWWVGRRGEIVSCDIDLRVGGAWRYVMTASSTGEEVAFHGEYREIVPDERLVSTEIYEPFPDHEAVNTLTLTEENGRTSMSILVQHDSKESRDGHVNSGMEGGLQEALDALEQIAVSLR